MSRSSTAPRSHTALVGAIAAVLLAAASTFAIKVALGEFADEYQLTATTARTGFGLDSASAVKIRGVSVGKVENVQLLDDGTVELTLAIRDGVEIPTSATASIEPVSVFGPKFVQVQPGEGEGRGPFLDDGDSLGSALAPSELTETLDGVSEVLELVDPEDLGGVLAELAEGVDGLGPMIGETIDDSHALAARLNRARPAIEELLLDAGLLADTLAARSSDLADLAGDIGPLLDLVVDNEDPLGDLLLGTSELATRLDDVLETASPELGSILVGVDGAVQVLAEQLALLPDFVDGLDAVSDILSTGLFAWERGPSLWGLIGHGIIDFEPCAIAPTPACEPREGYTP